MEAAIIYIKWNSPDCMCFVLIILRSSDLDHSIQLQTKICKNLMVDIIAKIFFHNDNKSIPWPMHDITVKIVIKIYLIKTFASAIFA